MYTHSTVNIAKLVNQDRGQLSRQTGQTIHKKHELTQSGRIALYLSGHEGLSISQIVVINIMIH